MELTLGADHRGEILDESRRRLFLDSFAKLEDEKVYNEVQALLAEGVRAETILDLCLEGQKIIGRLYEEQKFYLAGLILAHEMMRSILDVFTGLPAFAPVKGKYGLVLVGTIEGDIHDLGKSIASMFLQAAGYDVVDLGVDVSPALFLSKTLELQPGMVGISCLIIQCLPALKRAVHLLKTEIPTDYRHPFVIIGAAQWMNKSSKDLTRMPTLENSNQTLQLCRQACESHRSGRQRSYPKGNTPGRGHDQG